MSNTNERDIFTPIPIFRNFTVLSMEFPITNCLPFFFQTDENIYQIIMLHTPGRCPNKSLIKKIDIIKDKGLLERTKIYYCFNSKGDNFHVNKL